MIKVLFDGKEYFGFTSVSGEYTTENNFVFKEVTLQAVSIKEPFKDFLIELNKRGIMLATLYIRDKIFIEYYINKNSLSYNDTADNGTDISLKILDRFIGLKRSDIIQTKPIGTLQGFITSILEELDYADPKYINKYQRQIKRANDLLVNGQGVKIQDLKSFTRSDLVEKDAFSMIGEACTLANVLLVSNGYDKLTLEKTNSYPESIFTIVRDQRQSNVIASGKYGGDDEGTPSKKIILNSSDKKDKNSAVLIRNKSGLPHIHKVKHISVQATYQDLANGMDFQIAGIKATENSYSYKIPNVFLDNDSNFFIPNRSIRVYDEKWGIDEVMTILQTGFTYDADSGSELTLIVSTKEAFDNNASIKLKRSLMSKRK